MKDLKKDILGGLVTIVLATTIGCTSLPLTSQEPINSNKNTYTIQKVKGIIINLSFILIVIILIIILLIY